MTWAGGAYKPDQVLKIPETMLIVRYHDEEQPALFCARLRVRLPATGP